MATVEVRSLTKTFDGDVRAVDGVDFSTGEGEFLVLLGPSGCGKTTLLRMIAGLETPTSGSILIGDRDVADLPPRARGIAMVFQSYALYPHKTIFDNIAFPLKAAGMEKPERKEKVEWAADFLGIAALLKRRPRHLSGGERQRVALARALVREPSAFLLDEPLSNLDAKLRTAARDDLKELHQRVGVTTVYVTHDQVEAMGMGDRIAVLSEGRIRQLGTPREIYHDPADTFVATFVGAPPMNIVERDDVLVGFRPERFLPKGVVEGAESEDALVLPFSVHRVEYLGSERHVHGTVSALGEETRVIAMLPSTVTAPVDAGSTHDFVIHGDDLRFFDKSTGRRTERKRV